MHDRFGYRYFYDKPDFYREKMKEYKCVQKGREKKATTIGRAKQQTKERCSNPVK